MKVALAVLTVLLVATPTAAAKGVASAAVCGADDCRALDPRGGLDLNYLLPHGAPAGAPRRLPFYRVRLEFAGPDRSLLSPGEDDSAQVVDITYVPAARAARLARPEGGNPSRGATWLALEGRWLTTFRGATAGLAPLPAVEPQRAGGSPSTIAGALALLALAGTGLLAWRRRSRA